MKLIQTDRYRVMTLEKINDHCYRLTVEYKDDNFKITKEFASLDAGQLEFNRIWETYFSA